jgi:hypothetical protein
MTEVVHAKLVVINQFGEDMHTKIYFNMLLSLEEKKNIWSFKIFNDKYFAMFIKFQFKSLLTICKNLKYMLKTGSA